MESIMSEATGQKHTRICIDCSVSLIANNNWSKSNQEQHKYRCQECHNAASRITNKQRMLVNGKYISKSHPLYKAGTYKGFTDAAFSSLDNYEASAAGQVYIIYNPSFPSWCKIGMAIDAEDRLRQYQTGSPYRDYELYKVYNTDNRRGAESICHLILAEQHERRGEWFVCPTNVAANLLNSYFYSLGEQLELL